MSSLFRKEALEHRKDRLYGEVVLLQPLSITILVSVVVVISLAILTILFWGTYARKESVHGYLLPDKGVIKIYAQQAGVTVSNITVEEGDTVKEGQPLVSLLSERSMQGGSDIDTVQLHEIELSLAHSLEQIDSQNKLASSQTAQLKIQIQNLKSEIKQIEQNLQIQREKVQILEERVKSIKTLVDNKTFPAIDYQKIVEELLNAKQGYQQLLSTKATKDSALIQATSELDQLPFKLNSQVRDIENKISELKQRQAEIRGRRGLEIRSPINGRITGVQAREGQTATNNAPLLSIIPKDAVLQAELFVPSRAIGFIQPGQTVRIRFEAFPYQRFGIYEGTVAVISKHVLLPQELPIPLELKEPVYRVTVDLKHQFVMAYGREFPLQSGMILDADIILEKQTLFRWILDPLISLKGRF